MTAILTPLASPSIPLNIQQDLANPLTPWHVSKQVFKQLQSPYQNAGYKKVQIFPENKEWLFIWRYFHFQRPLRYTIKRVHFIYERDQQKRFESNFSSIEREAVKFPPTWEKESRAFQRTQAIERWKKSAQTFSPFITQELDGRNHHWTHTKIIPLWHGTSKSTCDSICTNGFVFFGKKIIPGADNVSPKSTDDGYFGSGIYCTNSARYAADIYSQGHLLLTWVSMREPFPVVGDPDQIDMQTLRGSGAYKDYNAHYVPVVPVDPKDPYCSEYHPTKEDQIPICDEYVVFQNSQTLPQFWIELEVELLYLHLPNQTPQLVSELIPHFFKLLQNPEVDRDIKLRNFLNKELTTLLKLPLDDDLSNEQLQLYEYNLHLLTPEGVINKPLRKHLIALRGKEEEEKFPEKENSVSSSINKPPSAMDPSTMPIHALEEASQLSVFSSSSIPQSKKIIFPPPSASISSTPHRRDPTLFFWKGKVYRLASTKKFPYYDTETWESLHQQAIQLLENGSLTAEVKPNNELHPASLKPDEPPPLKPKVPREDTCIII